MIKFSFAIPVKDELNELMNLVDFLKKNKSDQDEIVIQLDGKKGSKHVEDYLRSHSVSDNTFRWHKFDFENDFSLMRNNLIKMCGGEYIIFLDSDEIITEEFIPFTRDIIKLNPQVDVFFVGRINKIEGNLTEEHIQKWGWVVNEKGYINFPDYQGRIIKNKDTIRYKNKVHEQLIGFKTYSFYDDKREDLCLIHIKDLKKQEQQNQYYDEIGYGG